MAKTDFTKVESILDEGLRKITVAHLLDLADEAKPESNKTPNIASEQSNLRSQTILALQRDMKFLHNQGQEPYELFGITKKIINKYLKNIDTLTSEEWESIKTIHSKVQKFKKEFEKKSPKKDDDALVEQQRRRHVNKRFNINEKWLPLT